MLSILQCLRDVANYIKGTKDYVTDQGTASGWRYRKWKSGAVEFWKGGTFSGSFASWNGGYGGSATLSLPWACRNGIAVCNAKAGTGYGMPAHASYWTGTGTNKNITILTWGSQSETISYTIYVIGTLT